MPLCVLGGLAKGLVLSVPSKNILRPTSVKLKRRVFDARQDWTGLRIFDLCAGTGAFGLEAWSRGALGSVFVESSPKAIFYLKKNVKKILTHFPEETKKRALQIQFKKLPRYLEQFKKYYQSVGQQEKTNTVLFFDPPYENISLYHKVMFYLLHEKWFQGNLYLESDEQKGMGLEDIRCHFGAPSKIFSQGTSTISLFLFE